jgi:RNA polymerase-binding transcription factor DksA
MAVKKKSASKAKTAKQTPAKKTATKRASAKKKVVAKKPPAKKPAVKKAVSKKPAAKKTVVKKVPAKKPAAKKPVAKKVVTEKAPAKKTPAKKVAAKKPVAKKAPAKKATVKKPVAKKAPVKKPSAKKTVAKKTVAKKAAAKKKAPAKKKPLAKKRPASRKRTTGAGSRPVDLSSVQILKSGGKVDDGPVVRHKADGAKGTGPKRRSRRYGKRDLDMFGDLLSKLRSELLAQMNYLQDVSLTRDDAGFSEEDGTDAYERQMALTLAGSESESVAAIDDALHRIADGSYGTCIECGCLISKARLRAMPFGSKCIDCKSAQENKTHGRSRY